VTRVYSRARVKVSTNGAYNVTYCLMEDEMFKHGPLCPIIIQRLLAAQNKLINRIEERSKMSCDTLIFQEIISDIA